VHNNQEMVCQLLPEGLGKPWWRCVLFVPCMSKGAQRHNLWRLIYTCQTNPHFLICKRYFSMFPEQNIRALSGTQSHHQGPKGFTGRSKVAKLF
jgi:hypothetical protein